MLPEGGFVDVEGIRVLQLESAGKKGYHGLPEPPAEQFSEQKHQNNGNEDERKHFLHHFPFKQIVITFPYIFSTQFCTPLPTQS